MTTTGLRDHLMLGGRRVRIADSKMKPRLSLWFQTGPYSESLKNFISCKYLTGRQLVCHLDWHRICVVPLLFGCFRHDELLLQPVKWNTALSINKGGYDGNQYSSTGGRRCRLYRFHTNRMRGRHSRTGTRRYDSSVDGACRERARVNQDPSEL